MANTLEKYPVCRNNHPDCFALMKENRCFCLTDTKFKDSEGFRRDCPFYKTEYDVDPEVISDKYREETEAV